VPDSAHPLPPLKGGWESLPFVDIDGQNWPLEFASKMLDIPVRDLQDLVRITGLQPAGTIRMASFSRKGRQPRAYPAEKLITIAEAIRELSGDLGTRESL
jgi:hypothetical protein